MRRRVAVGAVAVVFALSGCVAADDHLDVRLPPVAADFDYQLGGSYPLEGVPVIASDSTVDPAPGDYAICYVNGFQTQPGEGEHWLSDHPELVLQDANGDPFADPGWPDEYLLDISTAGNREKIAALVGTVVAACDLHGFDAVEIDNLDSWTRSDGAFTIENAIDLASRYARVAHSLGLAIAQKNGAGDSERLRDQVGFDFAVTEECMRYQECADYLDAYDGLVFDIEYERDAFPGYCQSSDRPGSMILRDLDLLTPTDIGYVYETC